jgi:hypothetical protein
MSKRKKNSKLRERQNSTAHGGYEAEVWEMAEAPRS